MERDLAMHQANRFAGEGEEDRAEDFFGWARPKGDRGQAARRRRAHPLGSAHAGEGAGGGAMDARLAPPLALVWLGSDAAEKREQGRERRERR